MWVFNHRVYFDESSGRSLFSVTATYVCSYNGKTLRLICSCTSEKCWSRTGHKDWGWQSFLNWICSCIRCLVRPRKITQDCTVHRWQRLGRAGRQYVTIQSPPVLINIKIALRWFTATHRASPLKVKVGSLLLPSPSALDFILCIYFIDFYSFYSTRVKDTNGRRRGAMLSTVTAHLWVRPLVLSLSQACSIKSILRKFISLVQAG